MIARQFTLFFYVLIVLCILTMIVSFTFFDFIEVGTATKWTMKYFALPILVVAIPTCSYMYLSFIRQHEKRTFESRIWNQFRTISRIFILTVVLTFILIGTTLSLILLTNAFLGENKTINLNAKILDYYTLNNNQGRTRHYIKIYDKQLDRIIELKVQGRYEIGQAFKKTMKIGNWGLLFSE